MTHVTKHLDSQYETRPVGSLRGVGETSDGEVIVPPDVTLDDMERDSELSDEEFGLVPDPSGELNKRATKRKLGETLLASATDISTTDLATVTPLLGLGVGHIVETLDGDIIFVDKNEDIIPAQSIRPYQVSASVTPPENVDVLRSGEGLDKKDKALFEKTISDLARLGVNAGSLDFLLQDKPLVASDVAEDAVNVVLRARLALYRLFGDLSYLMRVLGVSQGASYEYAVVSQILSSLGGAEKIEELARKLIGGKTGKQCSSTMIGSLVTKKVNRHGLSSTESTSSVRISYNQNNQLEISTSTLDDTTD